MKQTILFLLAFTALSCSSNDNNPQQTPIEQKIEIISKKYENTVEHGKYKNYLSAVVINITSNAVKGHVRFEVKDYGFFNSDTETFTGEKHFYASFESETGLKESYLLNAQFIKE